MNEQMNQYDEISLKELITVLINAKAIIAIVTCIAIVLTGIYTFGIANPVYESTSTLMIKTPTSVTTRYGTYTFPSSNNADYINFIYSDDVIDQVIRDLNLDMARATFKEKVKVNQVDDQNTFSVVVSDTSAEEAKLVNDTLVNEFMDHLRLTYKENAINTLMQEIEIGQDNLKNTMDRLQGVIDETKALFDTLEPIYTLQKALFADPEAAATYAKQLGVNIETLSQSVMVEEFRNDNYFKIESQLVDYETQMIGYEQTYENQEALYSELSSELNQISNISNEDIKSVLNGKLDVMKQTVTVVSGAFVPENPVSPRKALNLAIGAVLGLMAGIFIAFFKAYWHSDRI